MSPTQFTSQVTQNFTLSLATLFSHPTLPSLSGGVGELGPHSAGVRGEVPRIAAEPPNPLSLNPTSKTNDSNYKDLREKL